MRSMLAHDPVPWLMWQEGLVAVRARRRLGLICPGDDEAARAVARQYARAQRRDGSFGNSPMKTAGVLNLLDDLRADGSGEVRERGAEFLFRVLETQRGYERARRVKPGSLRMPFDLCGFFGPYEERAKQDVVKRGAQEMNYYREFEPLLGPRSPVRWQRRSSFDRVGPSSCYLWGLIPLCYMIEALCRAGEARSRRLRPAINALLGAQRASGGWCRNLGGAAPCSIHAVRALGAHPTLRRSRHAARGLGFLADTRGRSRGCSASWWRGAGGFAAIQACAAFDLPVAREIVRNALATVAAKQRTNGTFGTPCQVERVAAVLSGMRALAAAAPVEEH